jgi:hypothetical protein
MGALAAYVEAYDGVFEASDGNLISLYSWHADEAYEKNLSAFTRLAEKCPLPVYAAIPPRKMDALTSSLPSTFPTAHSERLYSIAEKELERGGIAYVDLYSALEGKSECAGDLYFKTDHHWTHRGAWLAYIEIVSAMGEKPLEQSEFEKTELLSGFRGSDRTKRPESESFDVITGVIPKSGSFECETVFYPYDSDENNTVIEGFYDMSQLSSWEPYNVYLGGNSAYLRVYSTSGDERDTLFVVRDSFALALAPYLACHYDLVLIDPRFYPGPLREVAERESADAVLILENMGSLTESSIKFIW